MLANYVDVVLVTSFALILVALAVAILALAWGFLRSL